ncbi:MAG: hypothetical protein Q9M94_03245 [Candidatus Gracilibacteria bacterium]|nr:hypothetical protein [Candidatus Gracilibacteria bacterium]
MISDNNTEAIVNGAIFLATSFASAGLGALVKGANSIKGVSQGVKTTYQSIAEVSLFSAGNLSYKNYVKGGLDSSDYLFTIMMGLAIASATKLKGLTGKTAETISVAGAYGGDPQKILQHFLKLKGIKNAKYGVANSSTAGSLTNST